MTHFVGLDVSVMETSVCVVDDAGMVVCERKVASEPDDIAVLLTSIGGEYVRVGIEAGPLSQWLVNCLSEADLPMVCVEIHQHGRVSAGGDGECYLSEMQRHGLGIAERQHQPRAFALLRADCTKDIGRFRPLNSPHIEGGPAFRIN